MARRWVDLLLSCHPQSTHATPQDSQSSILRWSMTYMCGPAMVSISQAQHNGISGLRSIKSDKHPPSNISMCPLCTYTAAKGRFPLLTKDCKKEEVMVNFNQSRPAKHSTSQSSTPYGFWLWYQIAEFQTVSKLLQAALLCGEWVEVKSLTTHPSLFSVLY